jgi:hypothetical protein
MGGQGRRFCCSAWAAGAASLSLAWSSCGLIHSVAAYLFVAQSTRFLRSENLTSFGPNVRLEPDLTFMPYDVDWGHHDPLRGAGDWVHHHVARFSGPHSTLSPHASPNVGQTIHSSLPSRHG